jgi:hypothetical protein
VLGCQGVKRTREHKDDERKEIKQKKMNIFNKIKIKVGNFIKLRVKTK